MERAPRCLPCDPGWHPVKRLLLVLVAAYAVLFLAALGMRLATRNAQLRALGGS